MPGMTLELDARGHLPSPGMSVYLPVAHIRLPTPGQQSQAAARQLQPEDLPP